jgi:hypothetical protein
MEHRSAANGDTVPNMRYGATLWLVGPNERPTDAQVTAYQTWRQDRWLKRYPDATQVKRHSDVRPEGTACPGPYVGALVTSGTLAQPPSEDDMPLDTSDLAKIKAIVDASNREVAPPAVWEHSIVYKGQPIDAGPRLAATHIRGVDVETDVKAIGTDVDTVLAKQGEPVTATLTPEQLAGLGQLLLGALPGLVEASVVAALNKTSLHVD